jgi:hypothetical protein
MIRKLRRGNSRLMIRFICFALIGNQTDVASLDLLARAIYCGAEIV